MTKKTPSPVTEKLRKMFPREPLSLGELKEKYPWVVGKMEGEGNNRTVLVKCTHKGCGQTRRTRTMDAFQVKLCEKHQAERDAELTAIRRKRWRARDKERRRAMREGEP